MRTPKTTWILALAVAIGGYHFYSSRHRGATPGPGATPAAPALSLAGPLEATPAPAVPPPPPPPPAAPIAALAPTPALAPGAPPPAARPTAPPAGAPASADALAGTIAGPTRDDDDDVHAAMALFRIVRTLPSDSPEHADAASRLHRLETGALERAARARAAGDAPLERGALTVAYLAATDAAARAAVRDRLDALAKDEFFSGRPTPDADFYTVGRGDTFTRIAAKFDFPVEGLQKINRHPSATLHVGERLKVPKGPIEIFIVKGEFRLVLICGGKFVKEYPVGTGRDGCTPEATFTIEEKIPEPTWHSKEGVFPFGHPKNILGTRWLGFKNTDEYKGFGIHGTPFPDSIGHEVSSGCVRMRNENVEELFSYVPRGAVVTIIR
jgi:LysM repeat protein